VIHTSDTPQLAQPTLENVPEDRSPGELTKPGSQLGLHPTGVTPAAPRGEGATGPASTTSQTNIDEDGEPLWPLPKSPRAKMPLPMRESRSMVTSPLPMETNKKRIPSTHPSTFVLRGTTSTREKECWEV